MSYSSGETPAKADKVQRIADGRTGRVADVQLRAGNMQGHDVVNIGKFDDGGVGVSMSLADEYRLVSRSEHVAHALKQMQKQAGESGQPIPESGAIEPLNRKTVDHELTKEEIDELVEAWLGHY
jgi:hypothetical protein